jgi:hypothetical protein
MVPFPENEYNDNEKINKTYDANTVLYLFYIQRTKRDDFVILN